MTRSSTSGGRPKARPANGPELEIHNPGYDEVFTLEEVLQIAKVQAVWRGHTLRKMQWLECQWMIRKGVRDPRTEFWSNQHGRRAESFGWAEQDSHIVESAADA